MKPWSRTAPRTEDQEENAHARETLGRLQRSEIRPNGNLYKKSANLLRLMLTECCFSSVRSTEAEDMALDLGTFSLPSFDLEEVSGSWLEVLDLNPMS